MVLINRTGMYLCIISIRMCVYGPHDLVPNDIFLIKFILMVQMSFFLYLVSFMIVDSGMIYDWKIWQPRKIWCLEKKKKKASKHEHENKFRR